MIQAMEAIKICAGLEDQVLYRRLICYDGLNCSNPWRVVSLRGRSTTCPLCGETPTLTSLESVNYPSSCPRWASYPTLAMDAVIQPEEFVKALRTDQSKGGVGYVLLDVRPVPHFQVSHLRNSINWPLEELLAATSVESDGARLVELIKSKLGVDPTASERRKTVVAICRRGNDSSIATSLLNNLFESSGPAGARLFKGCVVVNLAGGLTRLRDVANLSTVTPLV